MTHLLLNVDAKEHERAEKTRFLEQAGYTVLEADTEAEALRLATNRRPAVVIVNTRLPQIDGYRLGRQIKALPDDGPLVLLLAPAFDGPAPRLDQIADLFLPAPPYYPALLTQVRLLTRLADSAAERDRAARAAGRRTARQALLFELADLILRNRAPDDELFDLLFSRVEDLVGADVGFAHRLDPDGELTLAASHGLGAGARDAITRLEIATTLPGVAVATRTPVPAAEERIATDSRARFLQGLVRTCSCLPLLRGDGQVLGTVSFGSTERSSFEPDELDFLQTVCHLTALVVERAASSRALRDTESALRGFYDSAPFMMGIAETAGDSIVTLYANAAAARFAGVSPGDSASRSAAALGLAPDMTRFWLDHVRQSATAGEPVRFRYRQETHAGTRWLEATVTALPAAELGRLRFNFIIEDVSDRTERDLALGASEERLRVALAATRLGTWEWAGATEWVGADRRAALLYDLPGDEPVTWRWVVEHRVHPDDREGVVARAAAALNGDGWYRSVHRVVHRDGAVLWVQVSGQMFFEGAGDQRRAIRLVGTIEDVTGIKQAEDALRESEGRMRELIEALPLLAWTTDADGRCDYLSPQWVEYTGIEAAKQLGSGWLQQVHPADRERVSAAWEATTRSGTRFGIEFRIRRYDGEYCWFDTRGVPIFRADGRIAKWLGINIDVDGRARAEEALRDADRRKDEFLAMLSHELRNPLAPIRNSIALLRRNESDVALRQAREVIDRQVFHLTRLVDDLLDVSRITRGKIRLITAPISLVAVIERAVETTRPVLEARRIGLTVSLGPDPLPLDGDLTRLVQTVANLLNNAAKFSPEGASVTLTAGREGDWAVIRIHDEGVGITADLLPRIFDLFTQGDRDADRSQGGLGIGLTVVKAIVELHGGRITAASRGRGQGSDFTVHLPLAPDSARPVRTIASGGTNAGGLRILVVDDNQDGAESLALLLELQGYDVRIAGDGPSALEAAVEFEPAIVVLDIGLPRMDGYDVARRLRAHPATARALLIAVTGYGRDSDRTRAAAAGFDHHLVKPVDPEQLQALIAEHRGQETAST